MLKELLKGLEARQPQTVGNMSIIPLVAQETEYNAVGCIADIYLSRDISYDSLILASESDKPTILPGGYAIITSEKAQDRAVASKAILPPNKVPQQVNAFCVQSSQPGNMSSSNRAMQKFRMLPASIRKVAYNHRNTKNFSALWSSLGVYNRSLGVEGDFLKSFFERFQKQLDEFMAEFELVEDQRGAIILINDKVYGIEISPNQVAWAAQWESLIRDCYGSEAVAKQKEIKKIDNSKILNNVKTLEELVEKVNALEESEWDSAEKLVEELLNQKLTQDKVIQQVGDLKLSDIETDDYVGQVVRKDNSIIDLTFLRREASERSFKFRKR